MVDFSLADLVGGEPIDTPDTRILSLRILFDSAMTALRNCNFETTRACLASISDEVDTLESIVAAYDAAEGSEDPETHPSERGDRG